MLEYRWIKNRNIAVNIDLWDLTWETIDKLHDNHIYL